MSLGRALCGGLHLFRGEARKPTSFDVLVVSRSDDTVEILVISKNHLSEKTIYMTFLRYYSFDILFQFGLGITEESP